MNIFDDDCERNNQKTDHYHDWEDKIGASLKQNTNKEKLDFGSVKVRIFAAY